MLKADGKHLKGVRQEFVEETLVVHQAWVTAASRGLINWGIVVLQKKPVGKRNGVVLSIFLPRFPSGIQGKMCSNELPRRSLLRIPRVKVSERTSAAAERGSPIHCDAQHLRIIVKKTFETP